MATDLVPAAIEPVDERRTGRTGVVPVRAEHEAVEQQRLLVREELGELHTLSNLAVVGPLERVVFLELAAGRQQTPFCSDGFYFGDEFLLLSEQFVACITVGSAFVWKSKLAHGAIVYEVASIELTSRRTPERSSTPEQTFLVHDQRLRAKQPTMAGPRTQLPCETASSRRRAASESMPATSSLRTTP